MKTMTDDSESRRVLGELLETAADLSANGLLTKLQLAEVTALCSPPPTFTATEVQAIRVNNARMSQAAFAAFLNVSVSAVQKWESQASGKHPGGAAAKLLQLIVTRGIDAILP